MMEWQDYEDQFRAQGFKLICGIDEVGRGPLFGPVCAAAVVLNEGADIQGLNDSKKLTEKKREVLYDVITENALAYGIAYASEKEIDELNILNATYLAMKRAYRSMCTYDKGLDQTIEKVDFALIDGNKIPPEFGVPALAIVKGDSKCQSIAAASVLAKVSRDRLMEKYGEEYPGYGLEKHKGYPTKQHYEAIKEKGILPGHRLSFLKNLSEK